MIIQFVNNLLLTFQFSSKPNLYRKELAYYSNNIEKNEERQQ